MFDDSGSQPENDGPDSRHDSDQRGEAQQSNLTAKAARPQLQELWKPTEKAAQRFELW
jgi:hypothetical protein